MAPSVARSLLRMVVLLGGRKPGGCWSSLGLRPANGERRANYHGLGHHEAASKFSGQPTKSTKNSAVPASAAVLDWGHADEEIAADIAPDVVARLGADAI